ncbi:MAG: hypothetical protein WDN00_18220 [Limisphaerales bacterium]
MKTGVLTDSDDEQTVTVPTQKARYLGLQALTSHNGDEFTTLAELDVLSQDPAVGASAYTELCRKNLAAPAWRTQPLPEYACPLNRLDAEPVKIPKLLRAYLSVGAKICGPPALDRSFKTIDFLTMLDLEKMPALARQRFMS